MHSKLLEILTAEEIDCSKLSCAENAKCATNIYGVPRCVCIEGFEGDGQKSCTMIPSELKIVGRANPEVHCDDDLYYQVTM